MQIQLLPSSFSTNGESSPQQHLTCLIINDRVAIDAGSLAMAANAEQRENIRDIVLTHAHLDHIAGLPLFVDDLFTKLKEPIRIHARPDTIEILERDIFNWSVYPRFSELKNSNGPVMEYRPYNPGVPFCVSGLRIKAMDVNHRVPSSGFVVSDDSSRIGFTGDTAEMGDFWDGLDRDGKVPVVLIECAFPDEMNDIAKIASHLTPSRLAKELEKGGLGERKFFITNIKPMFRETVIEQIKRLSLPNVEILEIGKTYCF